MNKTKFSIITPSYNQANYINKNIQSVLNQHYDNFEHIIIDGGSTDNTVDILRKYPHLKWISEKDNGQSDAFNKGLKMSTGDIICWINSDDELADNALSIASEYFGQNPKEHAVSGARIDIDTAGNIIKIVASKGYNYYNLLNIDKNICQQSTFIRKSVFDEIGLLRTDLHYAMDYELFLRITRNYPIANISEPLAKFRLHSESKTGLKPIHMLREQSRVRKEYGGRIICPASLETARISMLCHLKIILGDKLYSKLKYLINSLFAQLNPSHSIDMDKDKIKLLLLDDSMPMGGKENLLVTYLTRINRTVFSVHFISQSNQGVLLPEAIKLADHYLCLKRSRPLDIKAILRLRRYLKYHAIDIVHTHEWLASLYLFIAALGLKIKKITTLHGYDRNWRNYLIERQILKSFNKICCVSNAQALHYYIAGMPWDKLIVLYNCFNINRFSPIAEHLDRHNRNSFEMVMVANYSWIKDPETVIKATLLLANNGMNIRLHLVGNLGELNHKYSSHEAIVFHGQRNIDNDFLHDFDLFVFSSFADTFGIALVEAMYSGLPVLVSDIPALMEIIKNGAYGFHYKVRDINDCARAISDIASQPDLRKSYAERAYHRSLDFSPEIAIKALESFYQELV